MFLLREITKNVAGRFQLTMLEYNIAEILEYFRAIG
jgi:hypothetical protein